MRFGMLIYPGVSEYELGVFTSVLSYAKQARTDVEICTLARTRGSIQTSGGLVLTPHYAYPSAPDFTVLMVPSGNQVQKHARDALTRQYLQHHPTHYAAVGSGIIFLGESGLIKGKQVATSAELESLVWMYEPSDVQTQPAAALEGNYFAESQGQVLDLAFSVVADHFDAGVTSLVRSRFTAN
ncbi:DJ-1/PfpI family protein [Deinococcus roseus]|uniref:DJ-1/PfpI domain-containing protein n=1 Tax=Deinococcus roseus TaxID=392414 RepID=A0ABQ2CVB0_9DEIO|nr:DJ-1/PfpI family protein [Deinococcus roseus]GGJ22885.1 hypothetical protein GCM10008938_06380 [Deinococcus roseus]